MGNALCDVQTLIVNTHVMHIVMLRPLMLCVGNAQYDA
jgi:hypothetical protein